MNWSPSWCSSLAATGAASADYANDFAAPGSQLIDYPFPLVSGTLAYLRLPRRLEKADADRLGAFIRTLVLEPQRELAERAGFEGAEQ